MSLLTGRRRIQLRQQAHRARRSQLTVENLERRDLMATLTWDGGAGTSNWADANNWDNAGSNPAAAPGSADIAVFGGLGPTGNITVDLGAAQKNVAELRFTNDAARSYTLNNGTIVALNVTQTGVGSNTINARLANAGNLFPGLQAGNLAGANNTTTANPGDRGFLLSPDGGYLQSNPPWADNRTLVYTGQIFDADGRFAFGEHVDDNVYVYIDGVQILKNEAWNVQSTSAGTGNAAPSQLEFGMGPQNDGWHNIEIRLGNGNGGAGPTGTGNGGTNWAANYGFGFNANPPVGFNSANGDQYVPLVDSGNGLLLRVPAGVNTRITQSAGTLTLANATNNFAGATTVTGGTLRTTADGSLGSAAAPITVASGATLDVAASMTLVKPLSIYGTGAAGQLGALVSAGNVIVSSVITVPLVPSGALHIASASGTLTMNSALNLFGSSLTVNGAGQTIINGNVTGGGTTAVVNAINETIFNGVPTSAQDNIETYRNTAVGAADARGLLTTHLNYPNDAAVTARAQALGAVGFNDGDFSAMWITTFTPNESGAWGFRFSGSDDDSSMWIDTDMNGIFETPANRFHSSTCCPASGDKFTPALVAGQKYLIGIIVSDGGGGGNLTNVEFKSPTAGGVTGGNWAPLNPSAFPGTFTTTIAADNRIIKNGGGELVINGVANMVAGLTVNGGTLAGTGTVTGPVSISTGLLNPGPTNVAGTLNAETLFRYYRFTPTMLRSTGSNSIQISELQLFKDGTRIPAITVTNPGGNTPANEGPANVNDNDTGTKWLDFNKLGLVLDMGSSISIDSYRIATANDSDDRDPIRWRLEGSNDNANWMVLDDKTAANYPTPTTRLTFLPAFDLPESSLAFAVAGAMTANFGSAGTDQVRVAGAVSINGAAALTGQLVGTAPAVGTIAVLINNDGSDAITGTFAGLANGATATLGGRPVTVFYNYNADTNTLGTGNDLAVRFEAAAPSLSFSPVANPSGNEGAIIPLGIVVTSNDTGNATTTVTISNIPAGAIITNGAGASYGTISGGSITLTLAQANNAFIVKDDNRPQGTPSGSFNLTITATSTPTDPTLAPSSTAPATRNVTVSNVAPIAGITGPGVVGRDRPASFSMTATDFAGDTAAGFTYSVNWGDMSPVQTFTNAGAALSASHTYATTGTFTVSLTVTDQDNASSVAATTTINVQAPTVTFIPAANPSGDESSPIPLGIVATNNDPANTGPAQGTFTVTISNIPSNAQITDAAGTPYFPGNPSSVTLTPAQAAAAHLLKDDNQPEGSPNGIVNLSVTATSTPNDNNFAPISTSATRTVTVENALPVPTVSGPTFVGRGQPNNFTFSATDSVGDEAAGFTFSINWGDATVQTFTNVSAAGLTLSHTYANEGTPTITLTVTDHDNESATDILSVTVSAVFIDVDGNMIIGGTSSADRIVLSNGIGGIVATINNKRYPAMQPENIGANIGRVLVFGGAGNDTITVTNSVAYPVEAFGGIGNDYIAGGTQGDLLYGEDGNDRLLGGGGLDTILGGNGNDTISGGAGNDFIQGDAYLDNNGDTVEGLGNDKLSGDVGSDTIEGGAGNDTINGGADADFLYGGLGNDTLKGDAGSDLLMGQAGGDFLYGYDGADVLIGGVGGDTLYGGNGEDLVLGDGLSDSDALLIYADWNAVGSAGIGSPPLSDYIALVEEDNAPDNLYGQGGIDWLLLFLSSVNVNDRARDARAGEVEQH